MICPCKSRIDCAGDDNPFTGFNTDAADCCTRIGVQYGVGGQLPALGSNWVNSNCVAFADACDQDTADSLALSGYYHCVALNNRTPPAFDFVDPPDVPTPWDVDVFGNSIQTCSTLCPDGLLFSFSVKEDQFFALSQLQADSMAHSFACKQLAINQVCMGALIPSECCINQTYNATISATGTFGPFTFKLVSGIIPSGLLLTTVSGSAVKLSGNPSQSGTFNFTIQATDSHGNFMRKAYTLNVVSISTGALPTATVGSSYSFNFTTSGTFSAPVLWSIASGSLPDGLSMDSSGSMVGTPTVAGASSFTVQVSDGTVTCQKSFSMTSNSASVPSTIVLVPAETAGWVDDAIAFVQNSGVIYGIGGTDFYSSVNGLNWAIIGNFAAGNPGDLTFGSGLFVTLEINTQRVWSSPDGNVWTSHNLVGRSCQACVFGGGRFVEVGGLGGDGAYSLDGLNWLLMSTGMTHPRDVAYGNGLFVAVGDNFEIYSSPDGITWTARNSNPGPISKLFSVCFSNGIFLAGGDAATIITSPDGINWTTIIAGTVENFESFEAVGGDESGTFVGITVFGSVDGRVYTSTDSGLNWTLLETEPANRFVSSTGIFFASLTHQILCGFYL